MSDAPLTDDELAEWLEWSDRATPGPWNVETESDGGEYGSWSMYARGVSGGDPKDWVWVVRFDDDYGTDQFADAHFIAACRSYVPRLIADLRDARERINKVLDMHEPFPYKGGTILCSFCFDAGITAWPCPTRKALEP